MASRARSAVDILPAIAAAIAIFMMGVYIALIRDQRGEPATWFIVSLAAATILALYGVVRAAPKRKVALLVSAVLFLLLGLAGIFSVGLPLVASGVLTIIAFGLTERR
jgi:uncharacterized membrane protein